jgi:hypothetical protein
MKRLKTAPSADHGRNCDANPPAARGSALEQRSPRLRLALLNVLVAVAACLLVVPCASAQARIAFVKSNHLWTVNPDGTRVRTLAKQQSDPAYSPDGKHYAFVAIPHGDSTGVYIADADGTHARKVYGGTGPWQLAWK